MVASVLTLAFDKESKMFPQELLDDFCANKEVLDVEGHFFMEEEQAYWTLLVRYENVTASMQPEKGLKPEEQILYRKLVAYRKKKSSELGIPAYMVATNQHFIRMIKKRVRNQMGLQGIRGFGPQKRKQFGAEIINIFHKFYEQQRKQKA